MTDFRAQGSDTQSPEIIAGIDLGTTNSLIACMEAGRPKILAGPGGERIVPSVVAMTGSGELVAGRPATEVLLSRPDRAVYSVKRLMGKGIADVAGERHWFPFRIAEGSESIIRIAWGDRIFTPPEISAHILRRLRRNAEACLGVPVTKAVITVPAYFNDAQRQATKDAGRIAGLDVLRLVNEPTAAALAYGLDKRQNGTIAVYDLGGGTFDISILKLHDGIFEVLATNGDTHLGGDDIDNLLLRIALEDIETEWHTDLSNNQEAIQLLRRAVITAKEQLSFAPSATIDLEYNGRRYQREVPRELFEKLIEPIVDRTLGPCRACLADAR